MPVSVLIRPFTAQSHPPFSVLFMGPLHALLARRYNCSRGHQSDVAKFAKSNREAGLQMTIFYHYD